MEARLKKTRDWNALAVQLFWILFAAAAVCLLSVVPVWGAEGDIFSRIGAMAQDVYTQIVSISTVVAVVCASIALVIRLVSKNQRAVEEATSWLKRIVICWVLLNSMAFIVQYAGNLSGTNYNSGFQL